MHWREAVAAGEHRVEVLRHPVHLPPRHFEASPLTVFPFLFFKDEATRSPECFLEISGFIVLLYARRIRDPSGEKKETRN